MIFKTLGKLKTSFQNTIKSISNRDEKEYINNIENQIGKDYNGVIIINFDNFLYHPEFDNHPGYFITDELGRTHGQQMVELQKDLLEKTNQEYRILNFETESAIFANKDINPYEGFSINSKEMTTKDSSLEGKEIVSVLEISKLLKERFPNAKVNLNFSISDPSFNVKKARKFFDAAKRGVKVNVSAGNNELSLYKDSVGVLYNQLKERGVKKLTDEHYIKIKEYRLNSMNNVSKSEYNFGGYQFDSSDFEDKLKYLNEGKFDRKDLLSLKNEIEQTYQEYNGTVKHDELNTHHKIRNVLTTEYEKLPQQEKSVIKENLSIVQALDYRERGLEFRFKDNQLLKLKDSEPTLFQNVVDKYNQFNEKRNDKNVNDIDLIEDLANLSLFLKEHDLGDVFHSRTSLPTSENYVNKDLLRQFPQEFYSNYKEQKTSEATARYSALNNLETIQFN